MMDHLRCPCSSRLCYAALQWLQFRGRTYALRGACIKAIAAATGLSLAACSRIRAGTRGRRIRGIGMRCVRWSKRSAHSSRPCGGRPSFILVANGARIGLRHLAAPGPCGRNAIRFNRFTSRLESAKMKTSDLARYALGVCSVVTIAACGGRGVLSFTRESGAQLAASQSALGSALPAPLHGTKTFNYAGGRQNFKVPMGVTQLTIKAKGGGSIGYGTNCCASNGGSVEATIPVKPGQSLAIFVGGGGSEYGPGFNGGGRSGFAGGGGASDVRQAGSALNNRVVVAGGGGGPGGAPAHGGAGGNLVGGNGSHGAGGGGGGGGTQNEGGAGGKGAPGAGQGKDGGAGSKGVGGQGGGCTTHFGYCYAGGGGGGGYYGGGGGGGGRAPYYSGGGGGGGSSFAERHAAHVHMVRGGGTNGNGVVVLSW